MKATVGTASRLLVWSYFGACGLGVVTGLGGGDSRLFFLGLLFAGATIAFSLRWQTKAKPLASDKTLHCCWVVSTTFFFFSLTEAHNSVMTLVPQGAIGVTFQGEEIREIFTEPGVYFKSPFASFKTQQKLLGYEVTLPGFTSDGAKVPVFVRALAVVTPENVRELFKSNPLGTALAPAVEQALRDAVASSVAQYSDQEIDGNRRKLESAVRDAASGELKGQFIELKEMKLAVFSPEDSVY